MPEKTAAQKKAQQKYMEKFVRVEIRMEAEKRTAIQAHAEAQGESVNGFINRAIDNQISHDRDKCPSVAVQAPSGAVVCLSHPVLQTAQEAAQSVGETVSQFIERAVSVQAQRDRSSLAMGINPTTGERLKKEA